MRVTDHRTGLAALLLAASVGCNTKTGVVSLHLVDGPGDYQQINLHVMEVQIHGGGKWLTLSQPDQTYDLLKLQNGMLATLAPGVTVPADTYTQVRLVLGPGNTVKLADGSVVDLEVPSGAQSGLKFVCEAHVGENKSQDIFVDIDGGRSIFIHDTGTARYILRPVVHCVEGTIQGDQGSGTPDAPATGAITGTLTSVDTESAYALAGVSVTAQTLDANGNPAVVRTVTTGADGHYVLDLLPVGATYYVVTQPVFAGLAYDATASGPLALTSAAPSATFDYMYFGPAPSGSVAGTVSPTATAADADEVVALQAIENNGITQSFVVRSTNGAVSGGVESYAMPAIPVGMYAFQATRRTLVNGTETQTVGTPTTGMVSSAATTTANLTVP